MVEHELSKGTNIAYLWRAMIVQVLKGWHMKEVYMEMFEAYQSSFALNRLNFQVRSGLGGDHQKEVSQTE